MRQIMAWVLTMTVVGLLSWLQVWVMGKLGRPVGKAKGRIYIALCCLLTAANESNSIPPLAQGAWPAILGFWLFYGDEIFGKRAK